MDLSFNPLSFPDQSNALRPPSYLLQEPVINEEAIEEFGGLFALTRSTHDQLVFFPAVPHPLKG